MTIQRLSRLVLMLALALLALTACEPGPGPGAGPDTGDVEVGEVENGDETTIITETEGITEGEGVTATENLAEGEGMTEGEEITQTEDMTGTDAVTGTTGMAGGQGVAGIADVYLLAYSLLDYGFENRDGEVSGEVEDLLIDLNDGRILFATLEYGGFLDLGDREIAVPLSAFSWGAENELILNFDEAALENFPDVGDDWPDFADPAWDDEVSGFWNNIGINPGVDITEASNTVVWAEDLLGYPLVDLGSGVGTIYNMIVDPATSRVRYVLVDFGTGAQADDPYIIPFSALNVESFDPATVGETGLAFDTEISAESLLTTPRFDRTLFLDTALVPAELLAEVDTYWSDQGYEVAGESE